MFPEINDSFLATVLDNIPVGITVISPEGEVKYVNKTQCYFAGRSRAALLSRTIDKMYSEGEIDTSLYDEVVREKKAVTKLQTLRRGDSSFIKLLVTQQPFFDGSDQVKYTVAFERDIENEVKLYLSSKALLSENEKMTPSLQPSALIYKSAQMQSLLDYLAPVLKTNVPILIQGDTGSGKEVLAQYIHANSRLSKKPLVSINCAALPEALLESELFGYEKGAFTGAAPGGKKGLFEEADGGTLFLDEINSLPLSLQPKLLRVLETNVVQRLGSTKGKSINFRLIVAANSDLQQSVKDGRFRLDLLYRINAMTVTIPPLCERRDDIIPLANHYLEKYCRQYHVEKHFSDSVYQKMLKYDWPGNVRELKNVVERLVLTSDPASLTIDSFELTLESSYTLYPTLASNTHISAADEAGSKDSLLRFWDCTRSLNENMELYEQAILREAMQKCSTAKKMAEVLQVDQSTISRKLAKYGLNKKLP